MVLLMEENKMGYECLSQEGFVDEFREVSNGTHLRKFCFVLGAGASKSSGIKTGQELVDIWEKDLIKRNKSKFFHWKNKLGIKTSLVKVKLYRLRKKLREEFI